MTGFPRSGGFSPKRARRLQNLFAPFSHLAALLSRISATTRHIARRQCTTIEASRVSFRPPCLAVASERAIQPFFQNSDATEAAFVQVVPVLQQVWGLE